MDSPWMIGVAMLVDALMEESVTTSVMTTGVTVQYHTHGANAAISVSILYTWSKRCDQCKYSIYMEQTL